MITSRKIFKYARVETPLGPMLAVADEDALYLLEFLDLDPEKDLQRLMEITKATAAAGSTPALRSIEKELKHYFEGKLKEFKTPIATLGTPFQKHVWDNLRKIPYGETCSYSDLAASIGRPTAFRAVAQANGSNRMAIIIPCHRVINADGKLGGYGGGISRKKYLLEHEKKTNGGAKAL